MKINKPLYTDWDSKESEQSILVVIVIHVIMEIALLNLVSRKSADLMMDLIAIIDDFHDILIFVMTLITITVIIFNGNLA